MPQRSKKAKAKGGRGLVALMLVAVLGAAAFAAYVKFDGKAAHVPSDLTRDSQPDLSIVTRPDRAKKHAPATEDSDLLLPEVVDNNVKLTHSVGAVPDGVKPQVFLVNETLKSLKIEKAKAIGLEVKDGVALMDFNSSIDKGYGTIEEGNLIKGLQMALGQFPEIQKFQIIVDGKPIDSLGNIDLSSGVPVIRPGQDSTTTSEDSNPPAPN